MHRNESDLLRTDQSLLAIKLFRRVIPETGLRSHDSEEPKRERLTDHYKTSSKISKTRYLAPPNRDNLAKTRVEGAIHPARMVLQLCRLVIAKEELDRSGSNIWPSETSTPSESIC